MKKSTIVASMTLAFCLAACGGNKAEARGPLTTDKSAGSDQPPATPTTASTTTPTSGNTPDPSGKPRQQLSELETKRIVDAINADIPKHKAAFTKLCGSEVDIEIDWASFGQDKVALNRLWSNMGVERLVNAFAKVCRDKAGKDAVKAKIHKIKAINVGDTSKARATVAGGTFAAELSWGEGSLGMNESELGAAITKAL